MSVHINSVVSAMEYTCHLFGKCSCVYMLSIPLPVVWGMHVYIDFGLCRGYTY